MSPVIADCCHPPVRKVLPLQNQRRFLKASFFFITNYLKYGTGHARILPPWAIYHIMAGAEERRALLYRRGIYIVLAILISTQVLSCQRYLPIPGTVKNENEPAQAIAKAIKNRKTIREDGHYVQYDSGVVYDRKTGLEWLAGPDRDTTFTEAQNWVASQTADGGFWRMPTGQELQTLYQKGVGKANMTPLLATSGMWVWAGETNESSAWTFNYEYGYGHWDFQSNAGFFRAFAVRNH